MARRRTGEALQSERVQAMLTHDDLRQLDDWRREQPSIPSRSEAIRQLIKLGLDAYAEGRRLEADEGE